jgi:hypothetical protein
MRFLPQIGLEGEHAGHLALLHGFQRSLEVTLAEGDLEIELLLQELEISKYLQVEE